MFRLTGNDVEALRERLDARSAVLREEIAHALHESPVPDGSGARRAELDLVLEALARIDAGRYGLCADCGAPIAAQRLLAQPQALRCTRCETERERTRARPSLPRCTSP